MATMSRPNHLASPSPPVQSISEYQSTQKHPARLRRSQELTPLECKSDTEAGPNH